MFVENIHIKHWVMLAGPQRASGKYYIRDKGLFNCSTKAIFCLTWAGFLASTHALMHGPRNRCFESSQQLISNGVSEYIGRTFSNIQANLQKSKFQVPDYI